MIPENRRIPERKKNEYIEYLKLNVIKKKLQIKIKQETGKLFPLKYIHNWGQKIKDNKNNFEAAIKLIRENGNWIFLLL